MAGTAYCRYSQRNITKQSGGRYNYSEIWIVPDIKNTGDADSEVSSSWEHEALNADGLPQVGDINQDGGVVVVSVAPRSLENQGWAYVDVRYQEDPLTLVAEVNYFGETKIKPAWRGYATNASVTLPTIPDISSAGPMSAINEETPATFYYNTQLDIRNGAGDRFDPPVTYECPLERVEITFHSSFEWHDTQDWKLYLKHWNKVDFTVVSKDPDNDSNTKTRVFPAGTLYLKDKRAPLIKEPYYHRLITLSFLYDPDTWGVRLVNAGPRCHTNQKGSKAPKNGLIPVTDTFGRPYNGIAELDEKGNQLVSDSGTGVLPEALIFAWWPINDYVTPVDVYGADFTQLDLFTPERELDV